MSCSDINEQGVSLIQGYGSSSNRLPIVKPPKGARILGTMSRWEYKTVNGKLVNYKVHMTVRGDQQVEGRSFCPADLYTPDLKHYKARLLLAISAAEGCPVWNTDTSQAFLHEAWAVTWYISDLLTGGLS